MSEERRKELEKQWRNADERMNRWLKLRGKYQCDRLAADICRVEDERMQRIEKELGYVPNKTNPVKP